MLARRRGSIVNVTTMVAGKAEFGPHGVRVNSVAPGPTRTPGVEAEWGETNEELGRSLPLGRTADPEEIAHAVVFLASPRASFITGSVLHADGGGSAS